MRYIVNIWLLFVCLTVNAQSLPELANAFNAHLMSQDNKHIVATVWVRDTKFSETEEPAGDIEIWQMGDQCYYHYTDIEVVQDKNYLVNTDHAEKTIQVYEPADPTLMLSQYSPESVSKFLYAADTVKPLSEKAHLHGFRIEYGDMDDGLEAIELFYDKAEGMLREMRFHYKFYDWVTQSRSRYDVRVEYNKYEFPQQVDERIFNTFKFIQAQATSITLQSPYQGYSLWVDPALTQK